MAAQRPFPTQKEDFEEDDRIFLSKVDDKYYAEDEEGEEWEFIESVSKWARKLDDDEIARHQQGYSAGVEETETAQEQFLAKKRKIQEATKNEPKKKAKSEPKATTAIYVQNLPLDATVDEIVKEFSLAGLIAEEIDSDKKRVKIYMDEEGNQKGDALIIFHQALSVSQAIMLFDDREFRWGAKIGDMRVSAADMAYKKTQTTTNDDQPPPVTKKARVDKNKVIKKAEKMNDRLADWDDDEEDLRKPEKKKESRWEKMVILRNMFSLYEVKKYKDDPSWKEDLVNDVKEFMEEDGEVLGITMYDEEEEGIITVRFIDGETARKCVQRVGKMRFNDQRVRASIAAGPTRFKKSKASEDSEEERINSFGDALEKA